MQPLKAATAQRNLCPDESLRCRCTTPPWFGNAKHSSTEEGALAWLWVCSAQRFRPPASTPCRRSKGRLEPGIGVLCGGRATTDRSAARAVRVPLAAHFPGEQLTPHLVQSVVWQYGQDILAALSTRVGPAAQRQPLQLRLAYAQGLSIWDVAVRRISVRAEPTGVEA